MQSCLRENRFNCVYLLNQVNAEYFSASDLGWEGSQRDLLRRSNRQHLGYVSAASAAMFPPLEMKDEEHPGVAQWELRDGQ